MALSLLRASTINASMVSGEALCFFRVLRTGSRSPLWCFMYEGKEASATQQEQSGRRWQGVSPLRACRG